MKKTAVVAGSTGLVGSRLVALLRAAPEYGSVVALARTRPQQDDAVLSWRAPDFDRLDETLHDLGGTEASPLDVFCCLGTTIKQAGSQAAFRRVDFDYVLSLARWARQANARRFIVVSALGASAASGVFYNRVKGEAEEALRAAGLRSLVILQPSLLDGARKEFRLGERLTLAALGPVRALFPRSIRPVRDIDVAATMLEAARADAPAPMIPSAQMHGASARV